MFSPELAAHNKNLIQEYKALTPKERREYHKKKMGWKRGRPRSNLTPEQKKERQKEAMKAWYQKNKDARRAYCRERRQKKRAAKLAQPLVKLSPAACKVKRPAPANQKPRGIPQK